MNADVGVKTAGLDTTVVWFYLDNFYSTVVVKLHSDLRLHGLNLLVGGWSICMTSNTNTHTHTHTHTYTYTHKHTYTNTHTQTHTHTYTNTHTHYFTEWPNVYLPAWCTDCLELIPISESLGYGSYYTNITIGLVISHTHIHTHTAPIWRLGLWSYNTNITIGFVIMHTTLI